MDKWIKLVKTTKISLNYYLITILSTRIETRSLQMERTEAKAKQWT